MAIKSSGQLSLRDDIAAEFGGATTNISLRSVSSLAGLSTPDAMSEFYGLSARTNDIYFETRRGWVENATPAGGASVLGLGMTFIGWFRVNSVSKKNQIFFSFGGNNTSARGVVFANYIASLNRISVELRDTNGTRRLRRQYPLHNSPNVQITGVSSSGTGWERDQRGNTDSQGWVQLAMTVDTSQSSYTGIRLYWNGQELTYSVNNVSSGIFLGNQVTPYYLGVGNFHWNGENSSNFEGDMDNFAFFNYVIGGGSIQSLYNEGNWFMDDIIDSTGLPAPVVASGLEGDPTNQLTNAWAYPLYVAGSSYLWGTHPAGYPA